MLPITIPGGEFWNPREECFETTEPTTLYLEHSLFSISKWEEKHHVPFLSKNEKSIDDMYDYIRCMAISEYERCGIHNVEIDDLTIRGLTEANMEEIRSYIENPMTATTFSDKNNKPSREIITNEIVYYWMVASEIPFECQFWHINKLLTLVRVCQLKSQPPKKMGKGATAKSNQALNAARRARMGSTG